MNNKRYCIGCHVSGLEQIVMNGLYFYVCPNPFCIRYKLLSTEFHDYKQMKLAQMGQIEK